MRSALHHSNNRVLAILGMMLLLGLLGHGCTAHAQTYQNFNAFIVWPANSQPGDQVGLYAMQRTNNSPAPAFVAFARFPGTNMFFASTNLYNGQPLPDPAYLVLQIQGTRNGVLTNGPWSSTWSFSTNYFPLPTVTNPVVVPSADALGVPTWGGIRPAN